MIWVARDKYGVSLHRMEPMLKPVSDDEDDPRYGDMIWISGDDDFQPTPNGLDDGAGSWLIAELGKDIPVGAKVKVRIVLAD